MLSLLADIGPNWVTVGANLIFGLFGLAGWIFSWVQQRKRKAAEAEAAENSRRVTDAQERLGEALETVARLQGEAAIRDEIERKAVLWEIEYVRGHAYTLTNNTGQTAHDVRVDFFGRPWEHFPHGITLNYRQGKTFLWATTYDENSCQDITVVWKETPEGAEQEFTLEMPF